MRPLRIAAALALSIALVACSSKTPAGDWVDFATLARPGSPNAALACAADICGAAEADRAPLQIAAPPQVVAEAILRIAGAPVETRAAGEGAMAMRYVAVTKIMRFRDDVDLLVVPDGDAGSRVCIYSRSRIGYSDLGANARRIDALFAALEAEF